MSGKESKAVVPKLRFPEFRDTGEWEFVFLEAIAPLVNDRVQLKDISNVNYVSTENMLPDFGGVTIANKLPTVNSVSSFQAGDVLLANIRPYLKKVWAANFSGGASNDVLVFRPRNSRDGQYVAHILKNNRFIDYVMAGAKGVKMPRGDINSIKEYPVPIPPETTEQQKIANCLSSLDEVIELEARKLDAFRTHKKGLMQQLFPAEGETTPCLRFPEFRNAGPWKVRTIEDLAKKIAQGGTPKTSVAKYWNGEIPWITPAEMGDDAAHHYTERTLRAISVDGLQNSSAELLPVNSVIVSSRAPIGYVTINKVEMATNQGCKGIVPKAEVHHEFLYFSLLVANQRLNDLGAGAGFKEISASTLKVFPILVPELPEQQKIADCLSSLDEVIDLQAQKVEALKQHKKGLMQQLFPQEVA